MRTLVTLLICLVSSTYFAQGTWTAKTDFPDSARVYAVAFSIGDKGYYGTGQNALGNHMKDFWEYNPATDQWTKLADFGGVARRAAVGFSANGKGYIGTGNDGSTALKDFWEYDPSSNQWTQISDLPAAQRNNAVAFAINNTGYVVTGYDGGGWPTDMWGYNAMTGMWSQKADFDGPGRIRGVGFTVAGKGYVTSGHTSGSSSGYSGTWIYDPISDSWSSSATWTSPRHSAAAFGLSSRGYVFGGYENGAYVNSCYEIDTVGASWSQVTDAGDSLFLRASAFSIGDIGYLIGGQSPTATLTNLWEYSPAWLGVAEQFSSAWRVFPNPANEQLIIQFDKKESRIIRLFNATGSEVLTIEKSQRQFELNLSQLSTGIYIVQTTNEGKLISKTIMVE